MESLPHRLRLSSRHDAAKKLSTAIATRHRERSEDKKRTLKLVLSGLGVAAGSVEVVADTTSGAEAEDEGHARLGHFGLKLRVVD